MYAHRFIKTVFQNSRNQQNRDRWCSRPFIRCNPLKLHLSHSFLYFANEPVTGALQLTHFWTVSINQYRPSVKVLKPANIYMVSKSEQKNTLFHNLLHETLDIGRSPMKIIKDDLMRLIRVKYWRLKIYLRVHIDDTQ